MVCYDLNQNHKIPLRTKPSITNPLHNEATRKPMVSMRVFFPLFLFFFPAGCSFELPYAKVSFVLCERQKGANSGQHINQLRAH